MNFPTFCLLTIALFASGLHSNLPATELIQSNVGKALPPLRIDPISNPVPSFAGKPMIVEFWATWCPPCRKSIPHLNQIYAEYKDKGLVVLGITDEYAATVQQFMKTTPMNYSVAHDSRGQLSRSLGIQGIPHAFLVNSSGIMVWEGHPSNLNNQVINQYLGSSLSAAAASPTGNPSTPPAVFRPKMAF